MYKIETHLHTSTVSRCGHLSPKELVAAYHAAGYSAICVTDHCNRESSAFSGMDRAAPGDKLDVLFSGCEQMKAEAERVGILIYEGAELRFDQCENDYLLYGFHRALLVNPERVMRMSIHEFVPLARADGALLIQAHPFRRMCIPAPAEYLDGIEVLNCNPRHNSYNDLARAYAAAHPHLIMTAGSDCHDVGDAGLSGILSETLPADSFAFAQLLRSGAYSLITPQ